MLDIIRSERLQENAASIGAVVLAGLKSFQKAYPCVGHVRGMGLFIGVEMVVEGGEDLPPAGHTNCVAHVMK